MRMVKVVCGLVLALSLQPAFADDPPGPGFPLQLSPGFAYGTNYVDNVYTNEEPPYEIGTQRVYEIIGFYLSWPSSPGRVYDLLTATQVMESAWTPTRWTGQLATPPVNTLTYPVADMTNSLQIFRISVRMD